MSKSAGLNALVLIWFGSPMLTLAQVADQAPAKPDYSKEAIVVEQSSDKFIFQNDGTLARELKPAGSSAVRCGVQQFWAAEILLTRVHPSHSLSTMVRVRKPDGQRGAEPGGELSRTCQADVTRARPFTAIFKKNRLP